MHILTNFSKHFLTFIFIKLKHDQIILGFKFLTFNVRPRLYIWQKDSSLVTNPIIFQKCYCFTTINVLTIVQSRKKKKLQTHLNQNNEFTLTNLFKNEAKQLPIGLLYGGLFHSNVWRRKRSWQLKDIGTGFGLCR